PDGGLRLGFSASRWIWVSRGSTDYICHVLSASGRAKRSLNAWHHRNKCKAHSVL
ncbi:unnamed protein product, partial [Musa acuminata var. zebrina]